MPISNYNAKKKKIIKDLGLHYQKIDASKNDSFIYCKEHAQACQCTVCGVSRWKTKGKGANGFTKKVPQKILCYFPITPRLQKLFMSSKTIAYIRWHFDNV